MVLQTGPPVPQSGTAGHDMATCGTAGTVVLPSMITVQSGRWHNERVASVASWPCPGLPNQATVCSAFMIMSVTAAVDQDDSQRRLQAGDQELDRGRDRARYVPVGTADHGNPRALTGTLPLCRRSASPQVIDGHRR